MGASAPAREGWLDRASAEEMEEEEEEEELRWGEFENGVAACDETSGSEGGCERANSAPMRRSWWWWWWKRKGGRREEEEVKKKRNEKKKRSKRQEFAPSRRFEKKKKNQKNQLEIPPSSARYIPSPPLPAGLDTGLNFPQGKTAKGKPFQHAKGSWNGVRKEGRKLRRDRTRGADH